MANWTGNSIRLNWAAALKDVRHGYELSGAIDYGFSMQDLMVLGSLHEAGLYQTRIRELLQDCNFHTESRLLSAGDYTRYREVILED